jgi:hypothetical protein
MGFCVRCEMPLLPGSAFCSACGVSMRARAKEPVLAAVPTVAGDAPPPEPDEEQAPPPVDESDAEEGK